MKYVIIEKAIYPGNMGFVELYDFMKHGPRLAASHLKLLIEAGRHDEALQMLEHYTGKKFDTSIKHPLQLTPSHKDPTKRRWMAKE